MRLPTAPAALTFLVLTTCAPAPPARPPEPPRARTEAAPRPRADAADLLPPDPSVYPLQDKIAAFLAAQRDVRDFAPTRLNRADYLEVIEGQVRYFQKCQDASGAIIDPVEREERQYATPCYALAVAILEATARRTDPLLLDSGLKAMDAAVAEIHEYRPPQRQGEFFTVPVMLAYDLYARLAPPDRVQAWTWKLADFDPTWLYRDVLSDRNPECRERNVAALCGEYLRFARGLSPNLDFVERHLRYQKKHFTPLGMYTTSSCPLAYDLLPRHFLAGMLFQGYRGESFPLYRDLIWKGAWTTLFLQSPFGELPTGHRCAQHIWNEAMTAVTGEIYAAAYGRAGRAAEAGAYKRAAHLALAGIRRWIRPDGSGYIVKNRYPPSARHGYESYSSHSQFNLLACAMLAAACLYADESVEERPAPADVGGFVIPVVEDFHKVFANAGGSYVEYDTDGDHLYNPTGLLRVHVRRGNPQLGPSDGTVRKRDKAGQVVGGEDYAVGPGWRDEAGRWHRLAEYKPASPPAVRVLEESPTRVRFEVLFTGEFDGATAVRETITIERSGVTLDDVVEGPVQAMRVYWPMLVHDGLEGARIEIQGGGIRSTLRDGAALFTVLEPMGTTPQRSGIRLDHRNGVVEPVFAEAAGHRMRCRITAP